MKFTIKNLNFKVGTKELLKNINMTASSGDMISIIGPNGAGKSTLLKHIATILPTHKEIITLDGIDLFDLTPRELAKEIAYLSQFSEIPNISVLETLELARRVYSGIKLSQQDYSMIDSISQEFELTKLLERKLATLSGGEAQKVMIAAALLQEPQILLLDEPISHLDPKNQLEVLSIIKKVVESKKIICFIVLHDIQHAIHYASRLVMLKQGSLLYDVYVADLHSNMLEELFDVEVSLHKSNNHTFIYYAHKHN